MTDSNHAYLALISHKMRTQLPNNTGDKRGAYLEGTGGEGENRDLLLTIALPSSLPQVMPRRGGERRESGKLTWQNEKRGGEREGEGEASRALWLRPPPPPRPSQPPFVSHGGTHGVLQPLLWRSTADLRERPTDRA